MTTQRLAGLRILFVEDEVMIADDMAEAFMRAGAKVLGPALSLEQAEAIVGSAEPIDAAVLDINLRGRMSYDLADRLIARGIPTVFATGYDGSVVPERLRHIARCDKPVEPGDLIKALGRAAA